MKESVLKDKSYQFALRVIKLYKYFIAEKKEYVLSKQILRSRAASAQILKRQIKHNQKQILFTNFQSLKKKRLKPIIGCGFCEIASI